MRKKYMLIGLAGVVVGVLLASVVVVLAGNLDSPAAPASTSSFTLEDIYNRLNDGTAGSPSTFTEPLTGPIAGSGHILDGVMAEAPALDNTDGAIKAEVAKGKTFWGLNVTAGEWGLQAGELYGGCTCTGIITPTGGTRWCDNQDGTVTDLRTCLVWLKKADWGGQKKWADCDSGSYDDAHTRAGTLKAADYTWLSDGSVEGDWRLPTETELPALANGTEKVRSGTPRAFTGVQASGYWTSVPLDVAYAIYLDLSNGAIYCCHKYYPCYVWPVRDGK